MSAKENMSRSSKRRRGGGGTSGVSFEGIKPPTCTGLFHFRENWSQDVEFHQSW